MKKAIGVFLCIVLPAAMSFAQSSGNFSYGNTGTTHCVLNNGGSGNIFLIRPSAVIGLLTDVTVGKNSSIDIGTSSALAGVDFNVDVKSLSGQPQANVIPAFPVTYASRFVQISTNLFNVLG